MRKIISKIALAFAIFGCLGSGVARAGNISLDVTASNISGVASKDPYSSCLLYTSPSPRDS